MRNSYFKIRIKVLKCLVILCPTVAMVTKTQTPSVKATLISEQRLHCQFAVDHRGANTTVEWHLQRRGERTKLFSHNSRTRQTQGSGVGMKALAGGDASYTLPFTKLNSEGTYICSVLVNPLFGSQDVNLQIEGEAVRACGSCYFIMGLNLAQLRWE